MLTRRHFLAASTAAFAANLFGAPKDSKTPPPELEKLGAVALREAKKYKATYCDIRIVRLRDQRIGLRCLPIAARGGTVSVPNVGEDSTFGFGVRVIVNGAWGFASSPIVTPEEIARITGEAVIIAKANATHSAEAGATRAGQSLSRPLGHATRKRSVRRFHAGESRPAAARLRPRSRRITKCFSGNASTQFPQRGQVLRVVRRLVHPAVDHADLRQRRRHRRRSRKQVSRARATTRPRRPPPAGNTCRR